MEKEAYAYSGRICVDFLAFFGAEGHSHLMLAYFLVNVIGISLYSLNDPGLYSVSLTSFG